MRSISILMTLGCFACGTGDANDHGNGAGTNPQGQRTGAEHNLSIYVKGDTTPRTFTDGLAGQTPQNYFMGLTRFDVMTAVDDDAPVTVFDTGTTITEADMLATTLVGSARLIDLPPASYTHGRVRLASMRADIDASLHATGVPMSWASVISVTAALANIAIDGAERAKGWARFSTTVPILGDLTFENSLPALPSTAGGTVLDDGEATWLVFEFPMPIEVPKNAVEDRKATIIYDVYQSFRWQDLPTTGFAANKFDVSQDGTSEPVRNFGATGYRVETE